MEHVATEIVSDCPAWSATGHATPRTPRWRVLRPLGEGGMGAIWEVEHVELGRRAALKTPHAHRRGRPEAASRLRDEAQALARIRHPGVPDVLDLGTLDDGRPYFVMERVQGRDLRGELTRHGVLSVPTAMRLVAQLLEALEAVHGAALVHRDIKLENLILRDDGHLVLIDFGLALRVNDPLGRTGRGRAVGTPRSMSPEQHERGSVDHRADLYAAGLCLFELIAGRGPFDHLRSNVASMHHAHCERTPPLLGDVAPQLVPPRLDELTRRALAKSPEDRFRHAGEMRAALRAVEARPRTPRWCSEEPAFADTQLSTGRAPVRLLPPLLELAPSEDGPGQTSTPWEVSASELMAV